MRDELIYGKFEHNGKEYPFVINDHLLSVVQTYNEHNSDFAEDHHFDFLKGQTNNNKTIIILGCKIVRGPFFQISSSILMRFVGYLLLEQYEECFDRIDFLSPALNAFYSPGNSATIETDKPFHAKGIIFKTEEETIRSFSSTINGEFIECQLRCMSEISLRFHESNRWTAKTIFSMRFPEPKTYIDIGNYYLYLLDFLSFVNFRSDIPLDEIRLYRDDKKSGEAVFFQKDCTQYTPDAYQSITYGDVEESLPTLFAAISERREKNIYNPFFIPENKKAGQYVDNEKWLIAAISFEGEFNKLLPDYKAETDQRFRETKELLLTVIDAAVVDSTHGINHKSNVALKSFRHLISNADTTVYEKFAYCLDLFSSEISELVKKSCSTHAVDGGKIDLADVYAHTRNAIAHGVIKPLLPADIAVYSILQGFIYTLILKGANVPSEKIKAIVQRLF